MSLQKESLLPEEIFMDLDRSGPVPLYFQVSNRIEKAIFDETLQPGARLENEISLANRLGLSRPTIRRAIQELVDKGLLVRRRGIGTQVVHGKVTRSVELTSLYEDLERAGKKPLTKVLFTEIGKATSEIAEHLGVKLGAPVLHIRRLRLSDGVPISILENYLPEEFTDLDLGLLSRHGLYQLLSARGSKIRIAKQSIGARPSTSDEGELLNVSKGVPLLTMERTAFDQSGRAVEWGIHCYRADLYSFEVTLVDR